MNQDKPGHRGHLLCDLLHSSWAKKSPDRQMACFG